MTIFLVEPRTFKDTDNTEFQIVGISAKVYQQDEVFIGSMLPIRFEITFWKNVNSTLVVDDTKIGTLQREYDIPGMGKVQVISGLFSTNLETLYQMATIVCGYYGYTVLPFQQQTSLLNQT